MVKKNRIPELIKAFQALGRYKLEIGIIGEDAHKPHSDDSPITILGIATVHEFGVQIEVSDKMRAFLHYQGLHLHPSTTHINIPERSYMRSGWDKHFDEIEQQLIMLIDGLLLGNVEPKVVFESIGRVVVTYLQEYLTDIGKPPNHPFTVARKKSSNPLVDTGRLKDAITWRVV